MTDKSKRQMLIYRKDELCHDSRDITVELDNEVVILKVLKTEDIEESRREKIMQIASDVTELNGMFQDLNEIVTDQWDIIDVVTENIESAKENVSDGHQELVKTNKMIGTNFLLKGGLLATFITFPVGIIFGIKTAIIVGTSSGLATYGFSKIN